MCLLMCRLPQSMLCLRTILLTLLVLIAMGLPTPSHSQPSSKSYTINSDTLASIDRDLRDGLYGKISGLAIYSGAKLIFEKYYGFNSRSTLHPISSVTKSITSLMVGICIDRGLLASVDIPVYHYFPEYRDIFMKDSLKRRITIRHLLNQTAGLRWDEWTTHYSYAGNQLIDITQRDTSWIDVFFRLPTECDPGLEFRYNSLASQVVKEVLCRAAGMDYPVMVDEYLLKPLGINAYHWDQYPLNGVPAWGGISMSTTDMARIGLLVAGKGSINGVRVVSPDWVEQSTRPEVADGIASYGLHWWVGIQPDGAPLIFAAGYGDQYVYIAPDKRIVIAINGQNFTDYKWPKKVNDLVRKVFLSLER